MLSAFTARPIIELKQGEKSKIETILAHGDRVLVGLNTGTLRVYRLNDWPDGSAASERNIDGPPSALSSSLSESVPNRGDGNEGARQPTRTTHLICETKFSSKAIEQLAVIKEANTIVLLSNACVSLHDLQTYELVETLSRTKNASLFAVTSNIVKDAATGIPEIISRLAVAVKRRLLCWSWHESELVGEVKELALAEAIRTITWASATKLFCGMNAGFVLVDVTSLQISEIALPGPSGANIGSGQASRLGAMGTASMGYMGLGGYIPKPLSAKLSDGEILLAKDVNTVFVTDEGLLKEKAQIPWQTAPDSIGYSYPYLLALQSPTKGILEIRNPETLSLLQTISLPGAAQLHFPPPTVSLAHAGKGFHISSDRCVWKMDATNYDAQVQQLVRIGRFDEAISLLNMLEDALLASKSETLREVKIQKAERLFHDKKFRASMDLFNEDAVQAPPERVLRLFPPVISGLVSRESGDKSDEESDDMGIANRPASAKKTGTRDGLTNGVTESQSTLRSPGFVKLLTAHRRAPPEISTIISSTKDDGESDEDKGDESKDDEEKGDDGKGGEDKDKGDDDDATSSKRREKSTRLGEKDLLNAVLELNSYLAGTRARLQRLLDPMTGRLKSRNTTKTEISVPPEQKVEGQNDLDVGEDHLDEKELRRTFTLVDTALFRAYMFSRPALAGSLFRIPNFCDPDVVNEKLLEHNRYNELVEFFFGKKLHHQALELLRRFGTPAVPDLTGSPALHGPGRTIAYLQSLPASEVDLILEHVGWVLRADPDAGMQVFLADSENAESLPRDRVVQFLSVQDRRLEAKYLEHITSELDDATAEYHNRLVELYVGELADTARDGQDWTALMLRFIKFLLTSQQYGLSRAFSLIPRDDPAFYEAQVVVLSNMGQHKQALELLVFKMKETDIAASYCRLVHQAEEREAAASDAARSSSVLHGSGSAASLRSSDMGSEATSSSIYVTLLGLYLTPPAPNERKLGPALDLLSRHGPRLPAELALSLVPDKLGVHELEAYFRGRMRAAVSAVRLSRLTVGLQAAELASSRARLHLSDETAGERQEGQEGRGRRVLITDERLCGACHKRLGGSVVSVLPNNSIIHYGCAGRAGAGLVTPDAMRLSGRW